MASIAEPGDDATPNSSASSAGDRYGDAGVGLEAGRAFVERIKPLAASTARAGSRGDLGGFGGLFDLAAVGFSDPILVAATDGVGTKVLLGIDADRLEGLGVDLVAMCVNDLVVQGAEPLFFLDYLAVGALEGAQAARLVEGVAAGCREAGCALLGGETAEMPGLYRKGHFDLAGFAVGAVERAAVLPRPDVAPGDVVLGVASSGLHSNGFSLVRLIAKERGWNLAAPAPFALEKSLAEALLEPTRIYARPARAAIAAGGVKAFAHITGGGLEENAPRALPKGLRARVDARRWPRPPLFDWLAAEGGLRSGELVRTFNGGLGLLAFVEADAREQAMAALSSLGDACFEIGVVEAQASAEAPPAIAIEGL